MGERFWWGCGDDFVHVGWDGAVHSGDASVTSDDAGRLWVCALDRAEYG